MIFPFDNLSIGRENELFCHAFYIDLVTELSRFRQFQIISPEPEKYSGKISNGQTDAVFETDYIIKGTFRSIEGRIIINAQLFNNDHKKLTWADRFEGSAVSIFSMQEDLLHKIVSCLQHQLNYDLLAHLRKKPAVQIRAYEYWLRGMDELKKGSLAADLKAREYFQQAIETEPSYSLAYSGLSLSYFNEWSCQLWERWDVNKNGAHEWAKKAIEIDDQDYVAAFVLGRTLLYNEEYDMAEHYLRKALRLNSNDTDSLVQIATCFIYLGFAKEAEKIYNKVLHLNPLRETHFLHIGTFIHLELGQFQKAIDLAAKVPSAIWVDFPVFVAAAHYHLGNHEQMLISWNKFLELYKRRITKHNEDTIPRMIEWIKSVNPYRYKTNLTPFLEHIGKIQTGYEPVIEPERERNEYKMCIFQKEAALWLLSYEGKSIRTGTSKGFNDLAKLLSNPNQPFHCSELMGSSLSARKELVFDEKAKKDYRKRLMEIKEEQAEAEAYNNHFKSE